MDHSIKYLRDLANQLEKWYDHIVDAMQYAEGTHTFDDIATMILQGQLVFITLDEGFYIVEVIQYPRKKVLNIFLAGGDLKVLLEKRHDLETVARNAGCSGITLSGRRGWEKYAKECGWRYSHTTLACDVKEQPDG